MLLIESKVNLDDVRNLLSIDWLDKNGKQKKPPEAASFYIGHLSRLFYLPRAEKDCKCETSALLSLVLDTRRKKRASENIFLQEGLRISATTREENQRHTKEKAEGTSTQS